MTWWDDVREMFRRAVELGRSGQPVAAAVVLTVWALLTFACLGVIAWAGWEAAR